MDLKILKLDEYIDMMIKDKKRHINRLQCDLQRLKKNPKKQREEIIDSFHPIRELGKEGEDYLNALLDEFDEKYKK